MKRVWKQVGVILGMLFLILMFGGCGKQEQGDFLEQLQGEISTEMVASGEQTEIKSTVSVLSLPEHWYNFSIYMKRWAPVIIVASLILGWLLYDIFKKNREVQKWAFDFLIIRIPVFTLIIVYVYAILYRMLNL